MSDDLTTRIQFIHAFRQIAERNQVSIEIADLIFMRLANIEDVDVLSGIQTALQFFGLNLRRSGAYRSFLAANAAELLIVDQSRNGTIRTAHRAVGILA